MLRHYNAFNGSSLPVIIYELAHLLKATPSLTAFYNQNEIYFYDDVHVGVAMDVGKGLKVVTLRDTAKLMPAQIFENLTDFAMRDIEGMLTEQDITGSTFTVTDLSAQNILQHQPLINGRQSGILGVGADAALAGHPMTLTLTFDHRVLTGREAATFLNTLKRKILAFTLPTPSDES